MKTTAEHISRFSRKEIDTLFANNIAVYKSKELVILQAPCSFSTSRILLITSRKVGNAPERNKLRRQGRAIFYEEQLYKLQHHCVIIFKAPAKSLSFAQFKTILVSAAHKKVYTDHQL